MIFRMRSAEFPHTWASAGSCVCRGLRGALLHRLPGHIGHASAYDPPLSFYNSSQDADLSDTVLAGHLHAGVDYSLSDKTLLGLKLTYSMLGSMEARDGYAIHPFHEQDPDFSNYNRFTGARSWALTFTVKRLFGN